MWWLALAFVLLLVLKLWPKGLWFILVVTMVAISGILFYGWHVDKQLAHVMLEASYDTSACPAALPIAVTITNNGDQALARVQFSIKARQPGYSTIITPYSYKRYASEKILQPGEHFTSCYEKPLISREDTLTVPLESLEWMADTDKVTFFTP